MSWREDWPEWVAAGAGVSGIVVMLRGYLRTPVLLPVKRVAEIREELEDCRKISADLRERLAEVEGKVRSLQVRIDELMDQGEWWRERWRRSQEALERAQAALDRGSGKTGG